MLHPGFDKGKMKRVVYIMQEIRRADPMTIKEQIQEGIKNATKSRDHLRLDTLRMAKGAILIKEKEKARTEPISDEEVIAVLRSEVRKRQQSMATYEELGKQDAVDGLNLEIAVLEEYLPVQLSETAIETKVRAYLAEHPEINHAGKLTGALKKELGDVADGKILNDVCRRVLEG